jgi:hypothetical protein
MVRFDHYAFDDAVCDDDVCSCCLFDVSAALETCSAVHAYRFLILPWVL